MIPHKDKTDLWRPAEPPKRHADDDGAGTQNTARENQSDHQRRHKSDMFVQIARKNMKKNFGIWLLYIILTIIL